ncbi:uncharacterized protein LOC129592307 [Paramacrobiotus metropolitanus]|uniref:uncharacterized protein LOC129592307 n=1 Tax=Paramacrobiotus metropolitanus TaxID=2943436 RepID=UPI002445CA3C|nr:uncharacterized protein LOC129592307 [Paramacrobiotus metropolitanus]
MKAFKLNSAPRTAVNIPRSTPGVYGRTCRGFFEIDPVRTGSENVSIANTIFHSFGEIYTVTNSTLLRITKMFAEEEGYGYSHSQVFHPAYQMGVSFVLNKIYSAHSAMFNGTLEHHFSLENSTPSSALLTGRFKLPDGKGTFTTYMLFEGSSVQQTIKFNDKETTIFYTRTIPDWFYGAFEEVGEQDYARERFVDHAKNPDKPCPAKSGGLRLNISRSPDTREFILTMAPCEGAEPAAIPFKLNGTTELNDYNHLYSSLKATTFIKSRGSLLVDLTYTPRNSVSEAQKVSLDLTMAPFDPSTGISCVAFDGRSTRAIRMRRLFSPLMFGKFENAETPTTVLQIAPVNSTHFTQTITLRDSVTKESFAFNTPTKVLLEGANHPLIRHYFEHSGNGRPTLMTLTFHPPPPGAVVGKLRHANVKVFRAEGVDVYQNAIDTHKHSQQFYARKSS